MEEFNLKGIKVRRNKRSGFPCHLKDCGRRSYFKIGLNNPIGKALAKGSEKPVIYNSITGSCPDYNCGSYCSFDCLRRELLDYVFSAKIKMTPTIKDFLGQTEGNISDHEYISDSSNPNFDITDLGPKCYFKLSPNGDNNYPYILEVVTHDRGNIIGFNRQGAEELIKTLQTLVDNEDKFTAEREYMRSKRRERKKK